jgi:hypothetical protein
VTDVSGGRVLAWLQLEGGWTALIRSRAHPNVESDRRIALADSEA